VVKSFIGWFGKKEYTAADNKISLFLLISAHLQLLIGLALYFIGGHHNAWQNVAETMKSDVTRFWSVEHIASMIIGIAIITLGRIMAKKGKSDNAKHRRQAIYFVLAMVLIFSSIPWPFSAVARPWF
tara:strand:+ start:1551 stop:1931 length:381 start_codon:yes stop_codon:yes gene_type:complete